MRTETRKIETFYIRNSVGEYLQSPHLRNPTLKHGVRFTTHPSTATRTESKETAQQFIIVLRESGQVPDAELYVQEYEYSVVGPDEAELYRCMHFEAGTKRLLSAVNKVNTRRLGIRIAQQLGWEGTPTDLTNDSNTFFKAFNRWREQADLDFHLESSPGPAYEMTITQEYRLDGDRDREEAYMISGKGKTFLEAGCRAWLKAIIGRKREKKIHHQRRAYQY